MKNRVKEYREMAKMTQEELAEKSEVSRNTISSLETGTNTNVTYDTMSKIAKALNRKNEIEDLQIEYEVLSPVDTKHLDEPK